MTQDVGATLQPISTWAWVASHVEHRLPADEAASCHLAWDGDLLIGVLPLLRRGARLRIPADFPTRDGVSILAPQREAEALEALLESVLATEGRFRVLSTGGILEDSPVVAALEQAASGPVFHAPDLAGRCLRIAGTWSDYKSSLSRNFQRNLGRPGAAPTARGPRLASSQGRRRIRV